MSRLTAHLSRLPWREPVVRRGPAVAAAMLGGIVAAGAGLGVMAAMALFVWTTSPYAGSTPRSALHIAGALWLLAHGAGVLRTNGLTGASVPVGVTPLLLTGVPVWLVYRAAVNAVAVPEDAAEYEDDPDALGPLAITAWLIAGYLLVAVAVLVFTATGPLRGDPLPALLYVPLLAGPAALAGAWTGCCRPSALRIAASLPPWLRRIPAYLPLPYGGAAVALRAAVTASAVLIGGGALLSTGALLWHAQAAQNSFDQLAHSLSGRLAVLLLATALVPNAAVWGACYALGPGFAVGTGGMATIRGAHGYPAVLPKFPMLAELPAPTGRVDGPTWTWLALLVPLAAGVVLARCVARVAVSHRWPWLRTAAVALLSAAGCATALAVAAGYSGGPMGVAVLSRFGPAALQAGKAAFAWTVALGVPGAVAARWWGLHGFRLLPGRRRADAQAQAEADIDVPDWWQEYAAEAGASRPAARAAAGTAGVSPGPAGRTQP